MFCTKCGKQIADQVSFCIFCGAPVPAVTRQQQEAHAVQHASAAGSRTTSPVTFVSEDDYAETSVLGDYSEIYDETSVLFGDQDVETASAANAEPQAFEVPSQGASDAELASTTILNSSAVACVPPQQFMGGNQADDSNTTILGFEGSPSPSVTMSVSRDNGDWCALVGFPMTIGKGSEADLCITDNSAISRLHVRILRDGNVFAAEDLNSSNKTYINGYELEPGVPTIVSDGDELRLANEVLHVTIQ